MALGQFILNNNPVQNTTEVSLSFTIRNNVSAATDSNDTTYKLGPKREINVDPVVSGQLLWVNRHDILSEPATQGVNHAVEYPDIPSGETFEAPGGQVVTLTTDPKGRLWAVFSSGGYGEKDVRIPFTDEDVGNVTVSI